MHPTSVALLLAHNPLVPLHLISNHDQINQEPFFSCPLLDPVFTKFSQHFISRDSGKIIWISGELPRS